MQPKNFTKSNLFRWHSLCLYKPTWALSNLWVSSLSRRHPAEGGWARDERREEDVKLYGVSNDTRCSTQEAGGKWVETWELRQWLSKNQSCNEHRSPLSFHSCFSSSASSIQRYIRVRQKYWSIRLLIKDILLAGRHPPWSSPFLLCRRTNTDLMFHIALDFCWNMLQWLCNIRDDIWCARHLTVSNFTTRLIIFEF